MMPRSPVNSKTRMFLCLQCHVKNLHMTTPKHGFHVFSPFSAHHYIITDKGLLTRTTLISTDVRQRSDQKSGHFRQLVRNG